MNFAILGAGMVADHHRRAIAACHDDGARLVAVGHHDRRKFGDIRRRFGAPGLAYDDILSRDHVDAICICTPSGQHADQAIAAARAGKHVLVEKPIDVTLEAADRMIEACEAAGVKLGVVFQRRAEPLFRRVKQALEAGDLGDLTQAVVSMPYVRPQRYYDSAGWRGTWALDGGGVLMNQGCHLIDLLLWYMGDPVEVRAEAGTLHRSVEVEDTAAAVLRFGNGSVATITATTTAAPGFPHRLELYGTGGGIQIEGESVVRWTVADEKQQKVKAFETGGDGGAGAGGDPRGIALSGHAGIIKDFMEAVRDDRSPLVHGREGRRSLKTILDIYRTAGIRK